MKYVYANLVIVVVYVDDWLMTRSDEWHHHRRARVLWFLKIGENVVNKEEDKVSIGAKSGDKDGQRWQRRQWQQHHQMKQGRESETEGNESEQGHESKS